MLQEMSLLLTRWMSAVRVSAATLMLLALAGSIARTEELVVVDGATPRCVTNQPHQVQHPGSGTLFQSTRYGYCRGNIEHACVTARQPYGPSSSAYEVIPTACVGTFVSWDEIRAQDARTISDLKAQLDQELTVQQTDLKRLSDANDALTKRLSDLEERPKGKCPE